MLKYLMILRKDEIKCNPALGADLFRDFKNSNVLMENGYFNSNYDWYQLSDEELLRNFEMLVMRAYRQR